MEKDSPPNPRDPEKNPALPESGALGAEYAEPALEQLRAAVRGNGLNPRLVTVKNIDGKVAEFDARVSLFLSMRTMEKTVGGKRTEGEKVEGPQGLREAMERDRLKILGTEDIGKKIRAKIAERKDKGFGTRNEIIKLPFLTKEYVQHQPCRTCNAQGELKCQRCHGKGFEICPKCNGQSMEICPQCRGAQLIFMGNGKVPCPKCNGQGRTPCMMCHQTRKIMCSVCRSKGSTQCQNCNGQAWHSYMTTSEADIICTFDFDRENVPAKLLRTVETKARDVPLYAEITVLPQDAPGEAEEENKTRPDVIMLRYRVRLPYAETQFALGKATTIDAFLLGQKAEIAEMPAFLEILLKDGMQSLKEAGDGRGNVAAKMQRAGQYRTIRQTIIASAKYSRGKAFKLVKRNSPLGIGDLALKNLVVNADRALRNITAKPRMYGMITGVAAGFALYLAYMMAGLREAFTGSLQNKMLHIPIDGVVIGAGMVFALLAIQFFGASAMKKALGKLLPEDQESTIMTKAGHNGPWSALLCVLFFLVAAEISARFGGMAPDWYLYARAFVLR
ncbi:MAG: hypothetical protein WBK55_06890 [Alphaproteobacteria bacterium]